MAGLLNYAAGANAGIESILERKMKEAADARANAQLAETSRSHLAEEDFRNRSLDESMKLRGLQEQERQDANNQREYDRGVGQVQTRLNLRPIGSTVDPEMYDQERKFGADPSVYKVDTTYGVMDPSEGQGPTRDRKVTYTGNSNQLNLVKRATDAEERAKNADADRDAARQQTRDMFNISEARRNAQGPVVIIADPNNPGRNTIVPRTQATAAAQGGHPMEAPAPGGVQTQAINNSVSEDQLNRLEQMFDQGAGKMVGPAEGRLRSIGQQIPLVPVDKDFANFSAETSAFQNAVIKAITGAQMSEREADRIKGQIPLVTDKPEVWKAKAAQTRANLRTLSSVLSGKGEATPAGGGGRKVGRFEIVSEE